MTILMTESKTLIASFVFSNISTVTESDNLVGIATVNNIKNLPQEKWQTTPVAQIMNKGTLHPVKPGDDLGRAMKLIAEYDLNQIP